MTKYYLADHQINSMNEFNFPASKEHIKILISAGMTKEAMCQNICKWIAYSPECRIKLINYTNETF